MPDILPAVIAAAVLNAGVSTDPVTVVEERYVTAPQPEANIDSVSVSPVRPGRPALLFATAKETDVVEVFDASDGTRLRALGGSGDAPERYQRPNGVTVMDDLLVVVERDNRRINLRRLPDYGVIATFGADLLRSPYGLWMQRLGDDRYRIYVTDAYEMPDESVPPADELDERVKRWLVTLERNAVGKITAANARHELTFGETTSPGALRVVESIYGDPAHDRLLIAEEDEDPVTGLVIKVYDLGGRFTGIQIGKGIFKAQAEGIALYACENGSGYWLSTDQADDRTIYHVFDRETLEHVGAFAGLTTANTDGVWLAQHGVPGFEQGAFFAVHDDQAVSAFDWTDIASALQLDGC